MATEVKANTNATKETKATTEVAKATKKVTINKGLKQALKSERKSLIKELYTLNKVCKYTLEELQEGTDKYKNYLSILEHLKVKSHKDLVKVFKQYHRFQTNEGNLLKKATYYTQKSAKVAQRHQIYVEIEKFSISMVLNAIIRAYREDKVQYVKVSEKPSEGTISLQKIKEKGLNIIK